MELQTGEFPGWDRSPVAFIRTYVVSQFATIATTLDICISPRDDFSLDFPGFNRRLLLAAQVEIWSNSAGMSSRLLDPTIMYVLSAYFDNKLLK